MRLLRFAPLAAFLALPLAGPAAPARAQTVGGGSEVFAGSALETYLRDLQLTGAVPLYPWAVRAFSPSELDTLVSRLSDHPWANRYDFRPARRSGLVLEAIRPTFRLIENTTFPFGSNDGPIWAGRGVTVAWQMGFAARYGPLSLTVVPLFFDAANTAFPLMANGQTGRLAFADGRYPTVIDRPQRFGSTPYWRLDPGQTTLRVDFAGLTAGISTANETWGPAVWNPLVMSDNAAGIPRIFVGTSRPRDLWIGRIHGQVIYGDLRQTAWSPAPADTARRFGTGLVVTVLPRGMPGLEIGLARFFHLPWPSSGIPLRYFAWPFQTFFKINLPNSPQLEDPHESVDNQIAEVFARWVLPHSGFEIYGDYGHEDHNWSTRDFILEPDHSAAYTLGFGKTWLRQDGRMVVLRGEVMNAQPNTLAHARSQGPWSTHTYLRQGNTELGQTIGSPDATGGAGSEVSLESYGASGRWAVTWTRSLVGMKPDSLLAKPFDPRSVDVMQSLGVERTAFLGPADVTAGLTLTREFSRYFGSDATNLNAHIAVAYALARGAARAPSAPAGTASVLPTDSLPIPAWLIDRSKFGTVHLATLGAGEDDRLRLAQVEGVAPTAGYLIRSATRGWAPLPGEAGLRLGWVAPEVHSIYNSTLPYSLDNGALWAGRGVSGSVTGGLRGEWGPVFLDLVPEVTYSQNLWFPLPDSANSLPIPGSRSPWSSPYHIKPYSADLPIRFGDKPLSAFDFGQSTLGVRAGALEAGLSTENEWWGPGIRNAIVLSSQAAGIPRLFVRTARPLRTGVGSFEAEWFVGGLSESRFFDTVSTNNLRSISALALTWTPQGEPGLTLGLSRAVYGPVNGWGSVPGRLLDVFSDAGMPHYLPASDSSQAPGRDQIFSLFGRWVFPRDHFEAWFEWARMELPSSLRDLLTAPNQSQGYTVGLQWAPPVRAGRGVIRMQTEATYLEKSPMYRDRPVATWYTSRSVIQGYTQEGQVIGASIGPGASSQWLAVDYLTSGWSVGGFISRIRWEDDALYDVHQDVAPYYNAHCSHDVSLIAGVRGEAAGALGRLSGTVSVAHRLDAFFRNGTWCDEGQVAALIYSPTNLTLEFRFSPRIP